MGNAGQGDLPAAITIDNSGNVYVTGTDQKIAYWYDYLTIKYNNNGQTQWTARYDGKVKGNDWPTSLDVDQNGNVYVTGQSIGTNFTWDIATVKYSSSGIKQWARTFDGAGHGDDIGYSVKADQNGNVYVGGTSMSSSNLNYTTIKYNSGGNKESEETNENENITRLEVFPNPSNSISTISYFLTKNSAVKFMISDEQGKVVKELNFADVSAGEHSFDFDSRELSPGVYFCRMISDYDTNTHQLIVVK